MTAMSDPNLRSGDQTGRHPDENPDLTAGPQPGDEQPQLSNLTSEEARDNTFFLGYYVSFLLRHGKVNDAEPWLVRLERKDPQTPGSVELRARWLNARGQGGKAVELLDELGFLSLCESRELRPRQRCRMLPVTLYRRNFVFLKLRERIASRRLTDLEFTGNGALPVANVFPVERPREPKEPSEIMR